MKRTALVTGAAGFLGSHLVDRLVADGWTVVGLDDLSTGSLANLATVRRHRRFRLLRADLRRPGPLPRVGVIFHLASPASPPKYQARPVATLETNSAGTDRLLGHAAKTRGRFMLASTSEVYGDPEVHPQPETYWGHVNPIGVRSCYDEGKRFAEAISMAWHRERNVDVRIARIFNTYGPRMALDDGRVITNFLVSGWRGEPIRVQGSGNQTRSFCYVDDMVEGLLRLAQAPEIDGPVNLGNPLTEVTVLDLANRIRAITGNRSDIVFDPRAEDDPERRRPDISKAKAVLGWEPRFPLEDGLERTSRYVREALRA